jgi:fructose-1,6-bisphosphatase/inositol monophosphatase family enzyme
MTTLVKDAGHIALNLIDHSHPELKPDNSVITEADRRISALARERLAAYVITQEHVLIDEEDPKSGSYLDDAFLDRTRYVWAVDPIDATRAYANRMPHYGISLGLIRDRKPWLGAVYFPSLKEMFCCDGEEAFFIENIFTPQEKRTRIVPIDEELSDRSLFIATDNLLEDFEWRSPDCRVVVFSAAVCEFCWPTIGRGCGALARVHLWDMAGAWPIFEKAGLGMYSFTTGQRLERLETPLFEKESKPWKFKDYYILSSPRNFPLLRSRLIRKGQS